MAGYYNKDEIKEFLEPEQIYDLFEELGGNPTWQNDYIISDTICHNPPGEGSHKLYYYFSSRLCQCFTHCGSFDIFELVIKAMKIQKNLDWELYDAMVYFANYFGLGESERPSEEDNSEKWVVFKRHDFSLPELRQPVLLKEYNPIILTRFTYPRILDWEREGIKPQITRNSLIGYYAGSEQITIPHFDMNNRLIGIRGRCLCTDEGERFGKYKTLKINNEWYTHPLSMNLYNLNKSKNNIQNRKAAILFEGKVFALVYFSVSLTGLLFI